MGRLFSLVLGIATVATVAAAVPARADSSIRCEGGLVSVGDARVDLLGKCGLPALEERRLSSRSVETVTSLRSVDVVIDDWTYDFGPSSFVQVVRLENGRVRNVERLGYGHARDARPEPVHLLRATCSDLAGIDEGDGKLDVLARCGEPALRDAWEETRAVYVQDRREGLAAAESTTEQLETWTYDLGRNRFVQFVTFENGRVVRIRSGNYGYAD
jgi:hypothetical protein